AYFVAKPTANGGAEVVLTDLETNRPLGDPLRISSGGVTALNANDAWLAVAVNEPAAAVGQPAHRVELCPLTGGERTVVPLPRKPTAVAAGPGGRTVAAVLVDGSVAHAVRDGDRWRVGLLDGVTASTVAMTPDGRRLIVGAPSGRIAMLELLTPGEASIASRVALTFDGHSERVSVVRQVTLAGETVLISGDDAGSVIVRRL
ncbi:MAG: hypothetical protein AAGG46_07025, partial [Planctomycetota bacterium]